MKRRNLSLLAAGAAVLLTAGDQLPADSPAAADSGTLAPAGMVLHLDPTTKKIVDAPAQTSSELDDAMRRSMSTSGEGLVETPSPVKGGGIKIDLQGRFQHASTAVVGSNGDVSAVCDTGEPAETHDATSKGPVK